MNNIAKISLFVAIMQGAFVFTACASSYEENTGTIDLTSMSVSGSGITVSGNRIEITEGGDFTVTGENTNGMIYVNTTEKVKLRLSGMNLKNENGPAIFFDNTEKALITITEGTENYVEDGSDYGDIDAKAAIFSNDDMEIKGNGTLTVTGNYKHGIASDDDLDIENGTINITANVTDGIHTNNTFSMIGGTLNITAVSDGIQAEEDVIIDSGTINVLNSEEGIESGTTLTVNGGDINIVSSDDGFNSGGGTDSGNTPGGSMGGQRPGGMGGGNMQMPPNMSDTENAVQQPPEKPEMSQNDMQATQENPGANHSGMQGGKRGGDIAEMQPPSDTAAPAEDGSTENVDQSDTAVDCSTYINGGTIRINAEGDGIDSNASIYISGGDIFVQGSSGGGDGAIDGNKLIVNGGRLFAIGESRMAMGVSEESEQCAFLANLTGNISAGSVITIKDQNGEIVAEYTADKQVNSVLYSDEQIAEGETYTIFVDGEEIQNVEMTSKQVSSGEIGKMGGMGGRRPGNLADNTSAGNTAPYGNEGIKVMLNGKMLEFEDDPVIENDTTMVPLRTIFEALGMTVDWDENTGKITAYKDDITITLTVGSASADKNGEIINLSVAPYITGDGVTLVPVRFISESCGLDVTWDENTGTVSIN